MTPMPWPTRGPLADVRPATDLLVADLRATCVNIREHDHSDGQDLYCLNLVAYMGERMPSVLRRLADTEAEARAWRDRCTATADDAMRLIDDARDGA